MKRLTATALFFISQTLKPASNWPGPATPPLVKNLLQVLEDEEFKRLKQIVGHPTQAEWEKEIKPRRV